MLHIMIYHQLTAPKNLEPHKRANLSENGGLGKRKSGELVKSRKDNRTRQKNKRGDI